MELLPTMRSVADELQECSDAVSRSFLARGETSTATENLAVSLKLLVPQVAYHKEVKTIQNVSLI